MCLYDFLEFLLTVIIEYQVIEAIAKIIGENCTCRGVHREINVRVEGCIERLEFLNFM